MHKRMVTLGLLAGLAGWALPVSAAPGTNAPTNTRTQTRRPPLDKGPGETRAEREKRLQRECRGRPNAGACEGYAN